MLMQTIATGQNRRRSLQCAGHYGTNQYRIDVADEAIKEAHTTSVRGTKPRCESLSRRSAVEGEAAVRRTHTHSCS
jgi:hypothetical protein